MLRLRPHDPPYSVGHTWHTRLNTTSCPPSYLGHLLFLQFVELASPTDSSTSLSQAALDYSARHRHRYHTILRLKADCRLSHSTCDQHQYYRFFCQQNTNISQDVRLHSTGILVRPLPLDRVQVVQRLHDHSQALSTQRHPL